MYSLIHTFYAASGGEYNPKGFKWLSWHSVPDMDRKEIVSVVRDVTERKQAEQVREEFIEALKDTLKEMKILDGLLPICSCCKKIRDDEGVWHQVEAYIKAHSEANFTHGFCPDCHKTYYQDALQLIAS